MDMLIFVLWAFLKYTAILLFVLTIYILWKFGISPYMVHSYYKRYSNVYVPDKFNFPFGDVKEIHSLIARGKFSMSYLCDVDASKYDIRLGRLGPTTYFEVVSPKALEELSKLIPDVVDRTETKDNVQFSKAFGETSAIKRSTSDYKRTRFIFTKLLGFNHASRHIPIIMDVLDSKLESWKEGEVIDSLPEMCDIALRIAVLIIFGKNINDEIEHMNYTTRTGEIVKMDFYTFFPQVMKDLLIAQNMTMNAIFPFLFTYGWMHPNNIDLIN